MKRTMSPSEWADEFKEFTSAKDVVPPTSLSNRISTLVHADLNPPLRTVFTKLAGIHLASGLVTVLFCPQFGVSPLGRSGLMPYLMKFGDQACMFGCGALFMTVSALSAALFLRREEVRKLRQSELLWVPALAMLSAAAFLCTTGAFVLSLVSFWLIGAVIGGLVSLELGWLLKA